MQIKEFCWLFLAAGALIAVLTGCHPSRKSIETTPGGRQEAVFREIAPQGNTGGRADAAPAGARTDSFLLTLLNRYPQYFGNILSHPDSFRVQIIYTRIDRNAANKPAFHDYYFQVDPGRYFYPASTVKLPTALLALQKLNELRLPGLDRNSTLITGQSYSGQTAVYNDPTSADGRPSVAQYVKKIFLVSDNDAFNRLYEFLGQETINTKLHEMGYTDAAILHRLEIPLTEDQNRHTNPVSFYDTTGRVLYSQLMQVSQLVYPVRHDSIGNAWYGKDGLVPGPMDFSRKNRLCLEDLHRILRSVLFPSAVPASERFYLRDEDYPFVWQYLSEYPGEAAYPGYDTVVYPDAYGKFLYWGSERGSLPKNFRIFSKEGDAYGFLTDISYFADLDKGIEFMLSATIYCNSDGILNDSQYDYDSVGLPFMKHLGRVVYDYELQRPRSRTPDLSQFRMSYR